MKIKIKKAKDLGKKNEGKELKKKSENKIFKSYVKKISHQIVDKRDKENEVEKKK